MSDVLANRGIAPLTTHDSPLTTHQLGLASFLVSEVAFFSTLIVVYLTFLGSDQTGPTPAILSLRLVIGTTICLLASSVTIHLAVRSLKFRSSSVFRAWWSVTICLAVIFLTGTAYEWRELIVQHDLRISTNMFGTTYYTLIGFHALHVTIGVLVMLTVLGLTLSNPEVIQSPAGVELVSWYWHFVDGVWVVVFAVVYVVGRPS
jgi:cytochrome c oxidase subunit III